jgi:DNA-directed RNA polymerase specialized sigma24 family protein
MSRRIEVRDVQDFYDEVVTRITDESLRSRLEADSLIYALSTALTERQILILNLRLRDWNVKDISDELGISRTTIALERRRIRQAAAQILRGTENG